MEYLVVGFVVALVVFGSWFSLRKRYCPKCGNVLIKKYLPDAKSMDQVSMLPLPSATPLFYKCGKCDETYPAWQTVLSWQRFRKPK